MAIIIWLAARAVGHERASAGSVRRACIAARRSNVIPFTPRDAARPTISAHISSGILPRERQLLTRDGSTASCDDTTKVPPIASINASAVMMESDIAAANVFTECEFVKLHDTVMASALWAMHSSGMAERFEAIGNRLILLREALKLSQVEFCRRAGIRNNNYNPFEKGKKKITHAAVDKLKHTYGVSRDWIFDGEPWTLRRDLFDMIYGGPQRVQNGAFNGSEPHHAEPAGDGAGAEHHRIARRQPNRADRDPAVLVRRGGKP